MKDIDKMENSWKYKEMEKLLGMSFKSKSGIMYYKLDKIECKKYCSDTIFIYFKCVEVNKKEPFESCMVDIDISEVFDMQPIETIEYLKIFDEVKNTVKKVYELFESDK